MRLPMITTTLFVFAVGACVGSLINVLVYRLPRGLDVVTPTSRCPSCGTKLTWRENIPILGWLLLRGRCRFCQSKISAEYPTIEAIVAVMFAGFFMLWYVIPSDATMLGVNIGAIAPEWARNGAALTWPAFVVLLVLIGSLVAMTIIDARTCTIPLILTWVPALTALVLHTGHALWFEWRFGPLVQGIPGLWRTETPRLLWNTAPSEVWTLATGGLDGWRFIGWAIGGMLGLCVSNLLLYKGLIRRSFADYEAWEKTVLAQRPGTLDTTPPEDPEQPSTPEASHPTDMWVQYPHARREMIRELAFLAPAALFAMAGGWLAVQLVVRFAGPWEIGEQGMLIAPVQAPLWLVVLAAVCMGYLIGGGIVWGVRIFGTIAFGKEAMGLGDVHLMAAVGACLGWIDPVIAFFLAAFVGVAWAVLSKLVGGKLNRAMPYGPFLAVATLLVILGKPLVEIGLGRLLGMTGPLSLP
ncbi:MAG: prepilin peptidase [Planctomycetes bacterium]|nr:prepilin peptidase [Planctomycetota bacterium]